MKKPLSFLLTAAALYVIVCFAGCGSSTGSSTESELPDNPTQLSTGTEYTNESIGADGTRYYYFTLSSNDAVSIIMTDITGGADITCTLYTDASWSNAVYTWSPGDSSHEEDLTGPHNYYLKVKEHSTSSGTYTFQVMTGSGG